MGRLYAITRESGGHYREQSRYWPRHRPTPGARGRIINISSDASKGASPPISVGYGMSKAALVAFTLSLAADLGKRQITANMIAPGATETEMNAHMFEDPEVRRSVASMTALGRIGTPADIANVVALLASAESGWITGQYIVASGGLRL
jgi:3-oxoacyl-[acyl-carrier protein] reductase